MPESYGGNAVSVSWADHLSFGEKDGRLTTPDMVARQMDTWRDELGARSIYWRLLRTHIPSDFFAAEGYEHTTLRAARGVDWDDLEEVPRLATETGLRSYLYVSIFDDGWPLGRSHERAHSYHNSMHCQHVSWQTHFSREHPNLLVCDRYGNRQAGVLCLAHAEVRDHLVERFMQLVERGSFSGIFVCLRSQSRPAQHGDQYGYNEPVRTDFHTLTGHDLLQADEEERRVWHDLLGSYLTELLAQLKEAMQVRGLRLAVGVPRGDVLGPPLGNTTLQWRTWVREGLVDELIINQSSSRCPSMWHDLWPMHRGSGYLQNYLDGSGMQPLSEQLTEDYGPTFASRTSRLLVAWQWNTRSLQLEQETLARSPVSGLVYSSFRHDNPGSLARADWRA